MTSLTLAIQKIFTGWIENFRVGEVEHLQLDHALRPNHNRFFEMVMRIAKEFDGMKAGNVMREELEDLEKYSREVNLTYPLMLSVLSG